MSSTHTCEKLFTTLSINERKGHIISSLKAGAFYLLNNYAARVTLFVQIN